MAKAKGRPNMSTMISVALSMHGSETFRSHWNTIMKRDAFRGLGMTIGFGHWNMMVRRAVFVRFGIDSELGRNSGFPISTTWMGSRFLESRLVPLDRSQTNLSMIHQEDWFPKQKTAPFCTTSMGRAEAESSSGIRLGMSRQTKSTMQETLQPFA